MFQFRKNQDCLGNKMNRNFETLLKVYAPWVQYPPLHPHCLCSFMFTEKIGLGHSVTATESFQYVANRQTQRVGMSHRGILAQANGEWN